MVETIQHIQKTQTQTEGPSTSMEGWNTTQLGMLNTTLVDAQKSQEIVNSQRKRIIVEEIFLDISKQMLETNYILNLGQLFKITHELKKYIWQKLKLEKTQSVSKITTKKQVVFSVLEVRIAIIVIDNHMVIIQIQIGKNIIEHVLLDGGSGVNIITKQLRLRLGLPKPKPTPYNFKMANQTITKSMGLIKDLNIYVHGIPYITMFIVLQNNVVDFNYSMLLGRPS